jgi:hypothetical protein
MANQQNLKPWQSGQSGNPAGKPKGTKHLATWIQELMEDEDYIRKIASGRTIKEAPIKAIVSTLMLKALEGDLRAFDLLAKYGYGIKHDVTTKDQAFPFPILSGFSTDKYIKHVDEANIATQ